jgi:hypothetical protein
MSRKDVNEFVAKIWESPEFRRAFLRVSDEKATRPVRPCRCVVLEIPDMAQSEGFSYLAPGTVSAFVAREGDPLLIKMIETVQANDNKGFDSITDQIKTMAAEFSRRIAGAGDYVESQPRPIPSITEISYANKTLVSDVHVDEVLRVHVHSFPYNGGYLDRSKFSMVEYYRAGSGTPLMCVLLIRQPTLGEIEKEALRLVPSDFSANNIAAEVMPTTALIVIVEAAVEAALRFIFNEFVNWYMCILEGGKTAIASIPDSVLAREDIRNKIKSLPPEVTATELLRLRTEILLQLPSK